MATQLEEVASQRAVAPERLSNSQVYLDANNSVRMQARGQVLVFLLPSLKLKMTLPTGQTCDNAIHEFLLEHCDGYTIAAGHRAGYRRDGTSDNYAEHREYRVACPSDDKLPQLVMFLGRIATLIEEESIYVETADTSWLVYAMKPR